MYKLLGILKRPEGMDFDAFKTWWLTEHAPKVKQWPGLMKYAINLSTTADQRYDGIAEVWFDSREAMDAVFDTAEGQRARNSATNGSSDLIIITTEEHIQVE